MSSSTPELRTALDAIRRDMTAGRHREAADGARAAAARWADRPEPQNLLGAAFGALQQLGEAESAFRRAIAIKPDYAPALGNLGILLAEHDEIEAAEPFLSAAVKSGSALPAVWAWLATLVPPLPGSRQVIERQRMMTAGRIMDLHARGLRIDVSETYALPMFYLPYHGLNDRDLQREAAKLYVAPQPALAKRSRDERIRVGFISKHFRDHTIARLNVGTIAKLSREQFEVVVISTSEPRDKLAARIRASADEYIVLPSRLPSAREAIAAAQLDALLYTDIGMEQTMYTLAMSRLAPLQCATWGHPITTGIATIDYFISSQALETPESDEHYTERLVRLKDLAVCYERPPRGRADRGKFGFAADVHLYVCPQTPYKFHPDFDPVIGEILRRDPAGRLVLIDTHAQQLWKQKLMGRLVRTIPDVVDRIITLPAQPRSDFLTLLATADVMLDPLHFGGGNTSYEAFAMGTPIVTLPSQFLRGRITHALYEAMQVSDATARDAQHYVELAVRLGTEPDLRRQLRTKIDESSHHVFDNINGVRQLEQFLIGAIDAP